MCSLNKVCNFTSLQFLDAYNEKELQLIWYHKDPVIMNIGTFHIAGESGVSREEHGVCQWKTLNGMVT